MALLASAAGFRAREFLVTGPSEEHLVLTLDALHGGVIAGHVLDASGGPIPGALVMARVSAREGGGLAMAQSDAAGAYQLEIAARYADLSARADAYSLATRWVEVPSSGVNLLLAPGASACGHVIERGTGRGVEGTSVHARNTNGLRATMLPVKTEDEGKFCFDALPPGAYEFWVAGDLWRSARSWNVIGVGESASGMTLEAVGAGSLAGSIRSGDEPCADGSVALDGPADTRFLERTQNGHVMFEGLPPGAYTANVYCDAAAPQRERLEIGVERAERAWNLDAGLELRGSVRRANGLPLAAIGVFVNPDASLSASGAPPVRVVTNERGEFSSLGLLEGDYTLSIDGYAQWTAQSLPVQLSEHSPPVELVAAAEGSIHAKIIDAGAQTPALFAHHEDMNYAFPAERRGDLFVFEHLPLGGYTVVCGGLSELSKDSRHVELRADGEIATVELEGTAAIHTISGRVVDEAGAPLLDAWVTAQIARSSPFDILQENDPVLSNERGEFTLSGLSPGRYRIEVSSEQGQAVVSDVASDAQIIVRVPRFGVLSGSVRTPQGELAHAATLTIHHEGGTQNVISISDGTWALPWAAPGRYDLSAVSDQGRALMNGLVLESGGERRVTLDLDPI